MMLYLTRHGIAQQREDPSITSDTERALTSKGIKRTQEVARGLLAIGCKPRIICTSPLRRALETAEILVKVLKPKAPMEVNDFLTPGATVAETVAWLKAQKTDSAMLVGHMPDLADIAAGLLCKESYIDIQFKKAGVCCISLNGAVAEGGGQLEWLLQPRQLRAIVNGV
jgi:phosphohistidine phosphatase